MRITDVEAIYLRLPEVDATRADGTQDTLLVRIHTDEGITGIGEVDSVPLVIKAVIEAPPSHSIASGLRSVLLSENPLHIERLWEKMYRATNYFGRYGPALHAISGVDMALWDLSGKAVGKPVSDLLGGARRDRLLAYASAVMPETATEAGQMAEQYARQGYRAMKFGWGPIGRDPKLDEELIRTIRSAAGDDIQVMIDAGQVWNLKSALQMAEVYQQYNVFWLEEPLNPENLDGYRRLSERTTLPIAAGEQESGRRAFQRLLDDGQVDIIQPDLGRCGGLTEGKKIASLAEERHRLVVPHAFKTKVLVAASTHFAACIPNGFLIEHTESTSPLARDLVVTAPEFSDGYVTVPLSRPGLGVEIDEMVLERFRVS